MYRFYLIVIFTCSSLYLCGQDSLHAVVLDEVVVTGQYEPQAVDQSVFIVKSVNREKLETMGAIDLVDALNSSLNISLTPNPSDGSMSISMLGLSGQYVKVLIDGVPFAGVEGNGNNADITQINVNNIERVEVVEGPMAINYGANAVAGVINLITKQHSEVKQLSIQEESVGNEYGWGRGRHIQTLAIGERLSKRVSLQLDYRRNIFCGFQNYFKGKDYTKSDQLRGYDWHPKNQHMSTFSFRYRGEKWQAQYRAGYFYQEVHQYARQVFQDEHPATGIKNPYALDSEALSRRITHSLNLSGKVIQRIRYNVISAWSGANLNQQVYRRRIVPDVKEEMLNQRKFSLNTFTSRGTISGLSKRDNADVEVGYEFTHENMERPNIRRGSQSINNVAAFASLEWKPVQSITFRPGIRTIYNSLYPSPWVYSMHMKYVQPKGFDVRLSYGRSYRTPNLTELYYYFVDANHDVRGNENLSPEDGHTFSLDFEHPFKINQLIWTGRLKFFYNDISDQITLGVASEVPLKFQYINVDRFKSKGITFSNEIKLGQFSAQTGISFIGRYNQLIEEIKDASPFLFSAEINGYSTYRITRINLLAAVIYKRTGSVEQYVMDTDNVYRKGVTAPYDGLDMTMTWEPSKRIVVAGGVRNILDIRDIQTTIGESDAHDAVSTSAGLRYGRSYFMRITYSINNSIYKEH